MAQVTILHEEDRVKAINLIRSKEMGRHGLVFTLRQGTRTDAQNNMMWPMLAPISAQVELMGRKWSPDDWKCIFMEDVGHKPRILPMIGENSMFAAGFKSSKLGVRDMSVLLERIIAEATLNGITYPWLKEDMLK